MICTKGLSKDCLRATCNLPSPYKALETIVNSSSKLTRSSFDVSGILETWKFRQERGRQVLAAEVSRTRSFQLFPTPCLVSPCPWADFYPSLFTPHTSLSKNPGQKRAISLKHRHNLFEGGSYRRRGEADHGQPVSTLSLILVPPSFLGARPGHGSLPFFRVQP
jgi:hypothetical protein